MTEGGERMRVQAHPGFPPTWASSFLDRWASLGYWLAVIPAAGVALETRWWSKPFTRQST